MRRTSFWHTSWVWLVAISILSVLAVATRAMGAIDVKTSYQDHEPIVIKVAPDAMPEGAVLRKAKFKCPGATVVKVDENTFHLWAAPGKYTVEATGTWRLYQQIIDKNDKEWQVISDEDDYEFAANFEVTGGVAPDPLPPPQPPTPPGVRRAVILEETSDRTPQFALLKRTLLKEFPPERLQILDDDLPAASQYLPLLPSNPPALPVLLVLVEDKLVRAVPCPDSVAGVKQEIGR